MVVETKQNRTAKVDGKLTVVLSFSWGDKNAIEKSRLWYFYIDCIFAEGTSLFIKLQGNFIEIKLRHGFSPVSLLHTLKTTFPINNS